VGFVFDFVWNTLWLVGLILFGFVRRRRVLDFVWVCAQTSSDEKKDGKSPRVSEWNGEKWLLDGKVCRYESGRLTKPSRFSTRTETD